MAITQLGLHGPQMAYAGFLPKAFGLITEAEAIVIEVQAEDRTIAVPAEDRTIAVVDE